MKKASVISNEKTGKTLNLNHLEKYMQYVFDYEINSIKLDEDDDQLNCKMYYYDKNKKSYR